MVAPSLRVPFALCRPAATAHPAQDRAERIGGAGRQRREARGGMPRASLSATRASFARGGCRWKAFRRHTDNGVIISPCAPIMRATLTKCYPGYPERRRAGAPAPPGDPDSTPRPADAGASVPIGAPPVLSVAFPGRHPGQRPDDARGVDAVAVLQFDRRRLGCRTVVTGAGQPVAAAAQLLLEALQIAGGVALEERLARPRRRGRLPHPAGLV